MHNYPITNGEVTVFEDFVLKVLGTADFQESIFWVCEIQSCNLHAWLYEMRFARFSFFFLPIYMRLGFPVIVILSRITILGYIWLVVAKEPIFGGPSLATFLHI